MGLIEGLLVLIFIELSVLIGYWLAYLCKDELVKGRKWFLYLIITFFVLFLGFLAFGFYEISLTFLLMLVVSWISYVKSKDKKFVGK